MKQIPTNYFAASLATQGFLTAEKKHSEKSSQEMLHLTSLLQSVMKALSQASSGTPSSASPADPMVSSGLSAPLTDAPPSSQQVEAALAALATILGQLKTALAASNNSADASAIQIQIAQVEEAINAGNAIAVAEAMEKADMQAFQAWLATQSAQFQQWASHVAHNPNGDNNTEPDPLWTNIENAISAWVSQNLGITINWNAPFNIYNTYSIIQEATSQIQAHLDSIVNNASTVFLNFLKDSNNPVLLLINQMLSHGEVISTEDLVNLQNVLNQVLQMLATIAKAETESGQGGPSNSLVIQMLSMMTSLMNQLEGKISVASSDKGGSDTQVAQAFAQQAQQSLEKAQQQLAAIEAQEAEQKSMGIFEDIITALVSAIVVVVSLGTGAVLMAAVAATMCVLQESGALTKLTNAISKDIEADLIHDGVPPAQAQKDAQAIADAIVVIMVVVVTASVGAFSGVSSTVSSAATSSFRAATQEAAEDGIEMTAMGASRSADAAEEISTEATSGMSQAGKESAKNIFEKAFEAVGKLNIFRYLSPLANLTISTGMQAVISTNLISDSTAAVMTKENKSQEEIAHAQMIASIVSGLLGSIVTGMSAEGYSFGMKNVTKVAIPSMRDFFTKFPTFFKAITFVQNYVFGGMQVGASLATGASKTQQAILEVAMGEAEARQELMTEYEKVTDSGMQNSQKAFTGVLKAHEQIDQVVQQQMLAFEATFAQIFSQAV